MVQSHLIFFLEWLGETILLGFLFHHILPHPPHTDFIFCLSFTSFWHLTQTFPVNLRFPGTTKGAAHGWDPTVGASWLDEVGKKTLASLHQCAAKWSRAYIHRAAPKPEAFGGGGVRTTERGGPLLFTAVSLEQKWANYGPRAKSYHCLLLCGLQSKNDFYIFK